MTEKELVLTFPAEKVSEVEFKGRKMMRVETGMTTNEFIKMIMLYAVSDDETAAIVEKE